MPEIKLTKELTKPEVAVPALFSEFLTPTIPFGKMLKLSPLAMVREFTYEMDRLFNTVVPNPEAGLFVPPIDVKIAGGTLVVTTDLPGIKKEDVKIEVTDKLLVITGQRKTEEKEEKPGFQKVERSYGTFYREIPLPEGAKVDLAKADLTNGVLTISLPVPETKKAREILIEEGAKSKTKAA